MAPPFGGWILGVEASGAPRPKRNPRARPRRARRRGPGAGPAAAGVVGGVAVVLGVGPPVVGVRGGVSAGRGVGEAAPEARRAPPPPRQALGRGGEDIPPGGIPAVVEVAPVGPEG